MKNVAIVLLFTVVAVVNSLDPFCNESSFVTDVNDPPLPLLPDQFSFSVEAVLAERNTTAFATEYLDEFGNRGRFDFMFRGTPVTAISDYNLGESFLIPNTFTGQECSVRLLASDNSSMLTRFLFGIEYRDDDTVHIGAPSFIFYGSINTSRVNYLGIEESRGIPVHHWQTCVVASENNSYTLDYYFTNSDLWSTTNSIDGYVPVSVTLRGTRDDEGTVIDIEHYYTFVDFRTGNDSVTDDIFAIPPGLICANRITGKPLPTLPDYFSAMIEIHRDSGVQTYTEFYDFTHQLFRIDGFLTSSNTPFIVIDDYNTQTQYYIPVDLASSCSVSDINYDYVNFQAIRDSDGTLHLRDPRSLFFAQDYRNFVYEGIVQLDGIEADAWIAQNTSNITLSTSMTTTTFSNPHYQLYFSRPGSVSTSLFSSTTDPVPLESVFSATQTTRYTNGTVTVKDISFRTPWFSFSNAEPPLGVYDISPCHSSDEFVELRMRFKLDSGVRSERNLRQVIRTSLTEYARTAGMPFLTPLQVSNIGVNVDDGQYVIVHAHIANISRNSTVQWAYSATTLVNRLTQGVSIGGPLPLTIRIDNSDIVPTYYPEGEFSTSESSDLRDSSIALIAIGTFVVGVLVGVIAVVLTYVIVTRCCKKNAGSVEFNSGRQSESAAKYERQIDDVVADGDD